MSKVNFFKKYYAEAVKSDGDFDCDASYQELGGNSVGIFLLTETVKKDLGVKIDPALLLGKESSFNHLVNKYFMD